MYFSSKDEVVCHKELVNLVYYTCQDFPVLVFGHAGMGEIFLHDHLRGEKKVLKECVNALTIER